MFSGQQTCVLCNCEKNVCGNVAIPSYKGQFPIKNFAVEPSNFNKTIKKCIQFFSSRFRLETRASVKAAWLKLWLIWLEKL